MAILESMLPFLPRSQRLPNATRLILTALASDQALLASVCVHAQSLQLCPSLCDTTDCNTQDPLSMEFSRQEYWSGLPCPPPGGLHDPGIEPACLTSPALSGRFFTTSTTWEAPLLLLFYKSPTGLPATSYPVALFSNSPSKKLAVNFPKSNVPK